MPSHYRYSFTHTDGTQYRIDIAPPSDSTPLAFDTGSTALQDDAIIGFDELTWEYDKYPVGMHSVPTASITFDANIIPSDLLGWLCNAHITATPFQLDTAVGIANALPTLSTIIRVTHNLPGSAGWTVAGIYVVDPSARVKPDIDGAVKVAIIDALVASLKQITFTMMRDVDCPFTLR